MCHIPMTRIVGKSSSRRVKRVHDVNIQQSGVELCLVEDPGADSGGANAVLGRKASPSEPLVWAHAQ